MARTPAIVFEAGAIFRGYLPVPTLADAVELLWMVDGVPTPSADRILPNGVVELIINLGSPQRVVHEGGRFTRYRRAWLAGMQRGPLDIESEHDSHLVGIRFRPGGAAPFLALPMREVTDSVIEWEGWVSELRDRLLEAGDDAARLEAVESTLLSRRMRRGTPDRRVAVALEAMRAAPAGLGIAGLAARLGVSRKHLIELFKRDVGVSPKTLQRILRFQMVLRAVERRPWPRWTDLAYQCGYADQAHMNHDFRVLAGVSPTGYLASRTVDPNHLVTPAAR